MTEGERQQMVASAQCHTAFMEQRFLEQLYSEKTRPSVLYKPALTIDGDKWCALYGDNLQDGVAGFGDSPAKALAEFDRAFYEDLKP